MEKFFNIAGWIVGIISFFYIREFLFVSIESLGIVTYIDYGEERCFQRGAGPTSWEECEDGSSTDIALFFGILSTILAVGLGNIIHSRNFPPFSSTYSGKITYATWLVCSLLVCMTSFFVLLIIGPDFGTWINFGLAAIIVYYGYQHVQNLSKDD
jgi:hypothetical protein